MQVTLDLPDNLVEQLTANGEDPTRFALEALLVEAYRRRLLNESQIKRILGYGTRMQVHDLLKSHDVPLNYTEEHLRQDIAASDSLLESRRAAAA